MCKLMFGEHREHITQIILTAAEENVIFAIKGKLEGKLFSFFSFSEKEMKDSLAGVSCALLKSRKETVAWRQSR